MKIINRSDWTTDSLKAIVKATVGRAYGKRIEFRSHSLNRIAISRTGVICLPNRMVSSTAVLGGGTAINSRQVANALFNALPSLPYRLIDSLPDLEMKKYRQPVPKPVGKLAAAKAHLRKAETRYKLAGTILKKWQRRVKRLERKEIGHENT